MEGICFNRTGYVAEDLNLDNLAGTVSWDHPAEYSKVLVGLPNPEGKSLLGRFCFKTCWKRYFFLCCCLKNTLWWGQKETAQVVLLYSSIKLQVLFWKGFLYRKYNPKSGLYRYSYIFLSFFSSCVFVTRTVLVGNMILYPTNGNPYSPTRISWNITKGYLFLFCSACWKLR